MLTACSGISVLIHTCGWDNELSQDIPIPTISVSVMLPVSGTEGKYFTKVCQTAEDLITYLRLLDRFPERTLLREFNYSGPSLKKKNDLAGVNVDALLKRLQSLNLEKKYENGRSG
jgi:hypothetical protein